MAGRESSSGSFLTDARRGTPVLRRASVAMEAMMALPHESVEDEESVRDSIIWLEGEEARAYFDATARELVGMSGEEFLRRLDSGEWYEVIDDPEYSGHLFLASMRSFAE
jgi:hypothetical protein